MRTEPKADRGGVLDDDADGAGADEVLEGVLHRQREADRHDHQLGQAQPSPSQRLPQDAVLEPAAEAAEDDHQQAAEPQVDAGHVDQAVADHAAQGHLLGVREVRDPGGAVDQGEADAGQGQQQAEPDAVEAGLEDLVEVARGVVEVRRPDLEAWRPSVLPRTASTLSAPSGPRRLVGWRPQLEALGQGVGVHADEVVAGLGDREAELAVVLGGLGLRGAVGLGEDDVDVGDRVGSAADGAGDAGGLVRLRAGRGWPRRRTGWRAAGGAARRA